MARMSYEDRKNLEDRIRMNMRKFLFSKQGIDALLADTSLQFLGWLDDMLTDELHRRDVNKKAALLKHAGFPSLKNIKDYIWTEVKMPKSLDDIDDLLSLKFMEKKENLILYGVCGSGKTMLATCLGMEACRRGRKVKFMTLAQLSLKLKDAQAHGVLLNYLNSLKNLDMLIIDEWGYCSIDKESADLVFQVIADTYESKSLIVTTNLPFSEWGKIVVDEQLAAAIIDRVIHHGHLIDTGARDYRIVSSPMNQQTHTKTLDTRERGRQ